NFIKPTPLRCLRASLARRAVHASRNTTKAEIRTRAEPARLRSAQVSSPQRQRQPPAVRALTISTNPRVRAPASAAETARPVWVESRPSPITTATYDRSSTQPCQAIGRPAPKRYGYGAGLHHGRESRNRCNKVSLLSAAGGRVLPVRPAGP